ncbi:MAG: PaaI family thioesterase [Microthrixaceae bacterium]
MTVSQPNADGSTEVAHSPRVDGLHGLPETQRRVAIRRLAAVGREMIETMSITDATSARLDEAATALEAVVESLRREPVGADYVGHAEVATAGLTLAERQALVEAGDPEAWAQFDHSPLIGLANPMSPPLSMYYEGARVIASATFGAAFEGPPSCVHGGYIAAAFDEVLGAAQSMSGVQGMTANLSVNYRSPTPLMTPLRIEAWLDRIDGRKIFVRGEMYAGDRLTADASGLFIAPDPEVFAALMEVRADMTRARRERGA